MPNEPPGPITLRERKKLATRQALAGAAVRLAARRGLGNVRVEQIAAAAGVSVRTFNNYFSSKEEAIVSVALDRASRIGPALSERPASESLTEALSRAFVEQYIGSGEPNRKTLAQIQLTMSTPALLGAYLKGMAHCERSLAEAIAKRTGADAGRDLYPNVLAASAYGAARAAIRYWRQSRTSTGMDKVLRRAIAQAVSGWPENLGDPK